MIAAIFKDPALQARFERDGYVVFDFISPENAAVIAQKYYQLQKEIPGGFSSTASNPDAGFKKAISDHAGQVINARMDEVFQEYKKLGITFLCKAPGADGKVPVHRDWMVVDESKYFSGTIWIPMSDVNDANGALRVWPGSHKFFNHIRSSSIPVAYKSYEDDIWDQMVVVPMKAGQAFLLNHAVIHASSPNITNKERLILVCGIVPEKAALSYYHGTDKGTVEKFDMPDDMFMKHSEIGGRPSVGLKVDEFEYSVEPENRLRVQQLLTSSRLERISKPLFLDSHQQQKFATRGYLKMPVLNTAEVNSVINSLKGQSKGAVPAEVLRKIETFISDSVLFSDGPLKVIDATIETKGKNTDCLEPIHQELTCVENEDEHCSITCWLPLTDVSIHNGAPGFIEGSHLFLDNKRPSPQPEASYNFNGNMYDVYPYLQTVALKAGEGIFMDDRIFRCFLPNNGPGNVVALRIKLAYHKAHLCHYYLNPDGQKNTMLKYHVDESFFRKYDNEHLNSLYKKGERLTDYPLTDTITFKYPAFTTDELIDLLKATGSTPDQNLVNALIKNAAYKNHIAVKDETNTHAAINKITSAKPFWSIYSPANIVREIKRRALG